MLCFTVSRSLSSNGTNSIDWRGGSVPFCHEIPSSEIPRSSSQYGKTPGFITASSQQVFTSSILQASAMIPTRNPKICSNIWSLMRKTIFSQWTVTYPITGKNPLRTKNVSKEEEVHCADLVTVTRAVIVKTCKTAIRKYYYFMKKKGTTCQLRLRTTALIVRVRIASSRDGSFATTDNEINGVTHLLPMSKMTIPKVNAMKSIMSSL